MWFKSLSIYRLPDDFAFDRAVFEAKLATATLKPLGPTEPSRFGFVSPFGAQHDVLLHEGSGCVWLTLGGRTKLLPSAVVREACEVKIQAERARTQKNLSKRQREEIRDEVLLTLLPRAFEKSSRLHAYLDLEAKLLYVDSSSDGASERLVTALREALGSFPVEQVQIEESASAIMTQWVMAGECASPFKLGDECRLIDPIDRACALNAKRHDLALKEIQEHIRVGKKVDKLALCFDNRLSFVLDDKFKISKLKFLEIVQDGIKDSEGDELAELDTRFTLMVLELRQLTKALFAQFKVVVAG